MNSLEMPTQGDEFAFRELAGLCIRCGRGRREMESDLCGSCEYADSNTRHQIEKSVDYFDRLRDSIDPSRQTFLRSKKKARKSRSAA